MENGCSRRALKKSKMIEEVHKNTKNDDVSLKKEFTLSSGVAVIVGQIIGSGIFITPRSILSYAGSFGTCMVMWLLGACISIAGGLCYIELGLLVKRQGGEFGYLIEAYSLKDRNQWSKLFGSMLGFLFVWSNLLILRPASLGIQSLTCARYLTLPFFDSNEEVPEYLVQFAAFALLGKCSGHKCSYIDSHLRASLSFPKERVSYVAT